MERERTTVRGSWPRLAAMATGVVAVGGLVAFHNAAQGSVSAHWYIFFQAVLSLAAAGCEAGGVLPTARLRAGAMSFAAGVLIGIGLLASPSIGIAVLLLGGLIAAVAVHEGRGGPGRLRRIAGAAGFAIPWLGFLVFR